VQSWAPQSVTDKCIPVSNELTAMRETYLTELNPDVSIKDNKVKDCAFNPNAVAVLYNTMIVPFKHMQFKGGLWYQGV
jgi:hypothetical protein